ncbi:MAG: alpha/beta hydrolase, partial [Oscillibacter sp.]|nr:alpha/beta hydrolase [Oscillibacter sp.]
EPFTGGADDYLRLLTGEILPRVEKDLMGIPAWRGIVGYSLAGLFALYAVCQTDIFSRAGSISGSLWFPELKKYIFTHKPKLRPDCVYFSLGDKESKTRNPILKSVQQDTEEICDFYRTTGIDTVFQLNPGNHYDHAAERTAAGIAWLLSR